MTRFKTVVVFSLIFNNFCFSAFSSLVFFSSIVLNSHIIPYCYAGKKKEIQKFDAKKFFVDLATGGTAAAISKTAVAPIERVKILLQAGFYDGLRCSPLYVAFLDFEVVSFRYKMHKKPLQ